MSEKRVIKPKIYARAVKAIALIISWVLSAFSGLILWLVIATFIPAVIHSIDGLP